MIKLYATKHTEYIHRAYQSCLAEINRRFPFVNTNVIHERLKYVYMAGSPDFFLEYWSFDDIHYDETEDYTILGDFFILDMLYHNLSRDTFIDEVTVSHVEYSVFLKWHFFQNVEESTA